MAKNSYLDLAQFFYLLSFVEFSSIASSCDQAAEIEFTSKTSKKATK